MLMITRYAVKSAVAFSVVNEGIGVLLQWMYWRDWLWMVRAGSWWRDEPRETVLYHTERLLWWHSRCPVTV